MTANHDEIQALLGAYALHAVEPEEAAEVEAHLDTCPRCRAEVTGFQRAAPLLGSLNAAAPAGLWEEVRATLVDRPAVMPGQVWARLGRRRGRGAQPRLAVAFAAVVVVVGTLAGVVASGVVGGGSENPAQLVRDAADAAMSSSHHTVALRDPSGRAGAEVVIAPGDRAFFVPEALPRLAEGRTYQLWASVRGAAVSLGTVGQQAEVVEFRAEPAMREFLLTAEPEGGVAQPDSPVLAAGRVPA